MMIASGLNSIAQIAASRMADSLLEGTLIAALAGSVLVAARRLTSSARFAVCFSALVAIAVLAVAGRAEVPSVHLSPTGHPLVIVPAAWSLYIFAAWVGIAILLLARVGSGVLHVIRLRKSCVPVDFLTFDEGLRKALQVHCNSRRVALCTSGLVNVPTAIGFLRPAVVLPVWLLEELSAGELKQLVRHELAHLERYDDWTNLAQQIVKALFFFHPAVWWIERRISLEREMACDDAVVAETADPRAYAECLTHLAEKSMIRRGLALAQAALGRVRQTSLRVAEILRWDRQPAQRHTSLAGAAVMTALAIACGLAASHAPRLIAFVPEDSQIVVAHSLPAPQTSPAREISGEANVLAIRASAASMKPDPRAMQRVVNARHSASPLNEFAKTENSARQMGVVLPAAWNESSVNSATQDMYFVVESQQYLPSGVVVFRTSVYRIILHPDNPATRVPRKET